jgi:hypothetical protein
MYVRVFVDDALCHCSKLFHAVTKISMYVVPNYQLEIIFRLVEYECCSVDRWY